MSRRNTFLMLVAALALVAWAGAYAAKMQAQPTAVAVVDVNQIFNQIKEKSGIEAKLRERGRQLQGQVKQRRSKIAEMQSGLDVLQPGTDNYETKKEELERAKVDFQAWANYEQQKMKRERASQLDSLYGKMRQTVGQLAQERGYDVVLYKEPTPDFSQVDPERVSTALQMRKVLWSTDQIDLTDELVTRMNNEYDASR